MAVQGRGVEWRWYIHCVKHAVGRGVNPVLTLQSVLQRRKSRDLYFFILHIEL